MLSVPSIAPGERGEHALRRPGCLQIRLHPPRERANGPTSQRRESPDRTGDSGRWRDPDSNRGHHDFQSCALPTELSRRGGWRVAASRPRRRPALACDGCRAAAGSSSSRCSRRRPWRSSPWCSRDARRTAAGRPSSPTRPPRRWPTPTHARRSRRRRHGRRCGTRGAARGARRPAARQLPRAPSAPRPARRPRRPAVRPRAEAAARQPGRRHAAPTRAARGARSSRSSPATTAARARSSTPGRRWRRAPRRATTSAPASTRARTAAPTPPRPGPARGALAGRGTRCARPPGRPRRPEPPRVRGPPARRARPRRRRARRRERRRSSARCRASRGCGRSARVALALVPETDAPAPARPDRHRARSAPATSRWPAAPSRPTCTAAPSSWPGCATRPRRCPRSGARPRRPARGFAAFDGAHRQARPLHRRGRPGRRLRPHDRDRDVTSNLGGISLCARRSTTRRQVASTLAHLRDLARLAPMAGVAGVDLGGYGLTERGGDGRYVLTRDGEAQLVFGVRGRGCSSPAPTRGPTSTASPPRLRRPRHGRRPPARSARWSPSRGSNRLLTDRLHLPRAVTLLLDPVGAATITGRAEPTATDLDRRGAGAAVILRSGGAAAGRTAS